MCIESWGLHDTHCKSKGCCRAEHDRALRWLVLHERKRATHAVLPYLTSLKPVLDLLAHMYALLAIANCWQLQAMHTICQFVLIQCVAMCGLHICFTQGGNLPSWKQHVDGWLAAYAAAYRQEQELLGEHSRWSTMPAGGQPQRHRTTCLPLAGCQSRTRSLPA